VSRGKEKNPGSAFAWPGGGWLRTPLPWHSPGPDQPAGLAGEPGAGLCRNLPLIPAMSTVNPIFDYLMSLVDYLM